MLYIIWFVGKRWFSRKGVLQTDSSLDDVVPSSDVALQFPLSTTFLSVVVRRLFVSKVDKKN